MTCKECAKLPWAPDAKPRCLHHGCNIDLGSSDHKQKGFLGVDKRPVKNLDLLFDIELFPWPLPTECVDRLLCSHVLEHITPKLMLDLMDEMWRVMKPESQAYLVYPHADSFGFKQDPTHCNAMNEATFTYFTPDHPSGLYHVYRPKPWKLEFPIRWAPFANVEVVLSPIK
jgi:methyltransferase family protein